ncbi:MAG TPA: hypothetical protein VEN79_17050, partial [Terriglobia bacterium]|nr:hypothetical protein [Terriglobia bacterium]
MNPSNVKLWKADDRFFAAMVAVVAGSVLLGFSRTYFLAGMVHAKLPSPLVHLHAAIATLWIAFLAVQVG